MTEKEQELFEKIINKAVNNSWDMFGFLQKGSIRNKQFKRYYFTDQNYTYGSGGARQIQLSIESENSKSVLFLHISIPEITLDHSFCKSFFGTEQVDDKGFRTICGPLENWQYHIQQLALTEDRLKYLGQYI